MIVFVTKWEIVAVYSGVLWLMELHYIEETRKCSLWGGREGCFDMY